MNRYDEQVTQSNVPSWLQGGMKAANKQLKIANKYAPGFARRGYKGISQMADSGLEQPALDYHRNVLEGDYLYGGEGFNAALDAAERRILPGIQSRFESAGRRNSGLARQAEAQAIGDAFAGMYGQERANQQQAAAMAPAMADLAYSPYDRLLGAPNDRIQSYLAQLSSIPYSQPMYRNQGAGILGGALGGAQLGSAFGVPGALVGGGLGGLLGMF